MFQHRPPAHDSGVTPAPRPNTRQDSRRRQCRIAVIRLTSTGIALADRDADRADLYFTAADVAAAMAAV
jgi:hypothetical protein